VVVLAVTVAHWRTELELAAVAVVVVALTGKKL
jgi:hypothetical protein